MIPLVFLLSLGAALAAPQQHKLVPCDKNITLTLAGWNLPTTNISAAQSCQYSFSVPAGYYANVFLRADGMTSSDYVYVFDKFADDVTIHDRPSQPIIASMSNNWPTDFKIAYQTGMISILQIEIMVNIYPYPVLKDMGTVELQKNGPSSLVYLNELKAGYSYTFTSPNSVYLQATAAYFTMPNDIMQNVFVYDGDNLVGTLYALRQKNAFISTKLRIFCVAKIPLQGAIFVTDHLNVKNLGSHEVNYVPVDAPQQTTYATLMNYLGVDALTIIGDKNGSTPFDVRQINFFEPTSTISVLPGSPVADYSEAIVLKPNRVPYHFIGNINTFYAAGATNFKYTVTSN